MSKLVVITGASAGVGKEIADIMASKKWDLVLAARSENKLSDIASDLSSKYGVCVKTCPVDLASADGPEKLHDYCKSNNLNPDMLINNAGCGLFGESIALADKVVGMLHLNIDALTKLCYLFGSDMAQRGSGDILNLGSIAGNQPTAYFASYAASKTYVLTYSLGLRHEMKKYGVNVTCCQPGYIRTDFDNSCGITSEKYKKFSYRNGMSARAVAKCAVSSVMHKRSYVRAGFSNKCAAFFSGLIPKNFLAWILEKSISSMTKDSRK